MSAAATTALMRPATVTVAKVLTAAAVMDPEWQLHAACADHDDADLWWLQAHHDDTPARKICSTCPVLGNCRDLLLGDPHLDPEGLGVWAGLRGRELRAAARGSPCGHTVPVRIVRKREP